MDGELSRALGQSGGSIVKGWNAPNRLIIGRSVQPGQKIQLAVFGINGPLSNPPTNYIWMREAKLEFYKGGVAPVAITPSEVNVEVVRKDPAIDMIVPPNPKIFKLAEGFKFTEGPVWDRKTIAFSSAILTTIRFINILRKEMVSSSYSARRVATKARISPNMDSLDQMV